MWPTIRPWVTRFATWWVTDSQLRPLDEVLLLVLRLQPSEIDQLPMDDYWFWIEAAERELKRREQ